MSSDVVTFGIGVVVAGVLNGIDRWRATRAAQRASAPVDRLGANLGPRVQLLETQLARLEGRLRLAPLIPERKDHDGQPDR